MAIIFYYTATGEIYGAHGDLTTAPQRPSGISHIEVAETPNTISWPGGAEKESQVINGALVAKIGTFIYSWTTPGVAGQATVKNANDVDSVTRKRIRDIIGTSSPHDEEQKNARDRARASWARDHTTWPDGTTITTAQKDQALIILQNQNVLDEQIMQIRHQGKNFKLDRGW